MRPVLSGRAPVALAAAALLSLGSASAVAATGVRAPSRAARAAILRAMVRADGSTAGVTAVYLASADHRLAGVCQRTPDAGNVAFLFRASGRSWRFVLESAAANAHVRAERTLERACIG